MIPQQPVPGLPIAQQFKEYLRLAADSIPIPLFVMDLLLAAIFGFLIGRLYIRCGRSLSNRREFAHTFPLLVVTTMLVISIVKSSIALSLGLVGALSIVRFRSAVKEPEELTYLFFAIAIGLGFGGNQRVITICAFFVIAAVILIRSRATGAESPTLFLTVTGPHSTNLEAVLEEIRPHCQDLHLVRLDETEDSLEAALQVSFASIDQLTAARRSLHGMGTPLKISFLDAQGMA